MKMRNKKMTTVYTLNAVVEYLQSSEILESYKVTNVELLDFNDMEGWNYLVSVSVKNIGGYKNMRIKLVTNSTYLEGFEWNDEESKEDNFHNWLSELVGV